MLSQVQRHTAELEPGEVRRRLSVFARSVRALLAHAPAALPVDVHLYLAEQGGSGAGWAAVARTVTTATFPGDHFSMVVGEKATRLASAIERDVLASVTTEPVRPVRHGG